MAGVLLPISTTIQYLDNNVQKLAGGTINSYTAGTTTPINTYTDSTLGTSNGIALTLDANGRPTQEMWVAAGTTVKIIVKDSSGNQIGPTLDNISGLNDSGGSSSTNGPFWGGSAGGSANALTLTFSSGPTSYTSGQRITFLATATNSGATTINVNGLGSKAIQNNTAALVGNEIVNGNLYEIEYTGTAFQLSAMVGDPVTVKGTQTITGNKTFTGNVTQNTGTVLGFPGRLLRRNVYTSSTTYTKASDISFVVAYVQAGGGGSSGVAAVANNMGPGAGAGGWGVRKVAASSLATSTTVTVGASGTAGSSGANLGGDGGTSAFGAAGDVGANVWVTATGGAKGPLSVTTFSSSAFGGLGGTGTSGDVNGSGEPGHVAHVSDAMSGRGGSSTGPFGSSGGDENYGAGAAGQGGNPGTGYGSGASGATSGTGGNAHAGAIGGPGLVVVDEYA